MAQVQTPDCFAIGSAWNKPRNYQVTPRPVEGKAVSEHPGLAVSVDVGNRAELKFRISFTLDELRAMARVAKGKRP
jgi:hypothetical protein